MYNEGNLQKDHDGLLISKCIFLVITSLSERTLTNYLSSFFWEKWNEPCGAVNLHQKKRPRFTCPLLTFVELFGANAL